MVSKKRTRNERNKVDQNRVDNIMMTTIPMETETAVVATKTIRRRNAPKHDVASKKNKLSKTNPVSDPKCISRYLMPVHNIHFVPLPKEGNPQ